MATIKSTYKEKLLSNGFHRHSVPESYILPSEQRPGKRVLPATAALCNNKNIIPIIDLHGADACNRAKITEQIIEASKEFGFFQVIKHGISEEILEEMKSVAKEFFNLPVDEKIAFYSEDMKQVVRLYSSINYSKEETHYWRDSLKHHCHPVEDSIHLWPSQPPNYREVAASYSVQVRMLGLKLLELICEGLGLEGSYFNGELSKVQYMLINHYPPCPDPTLTLGLPMHADPNVITLLLLQEHVRGLQVLKDGGWMDIEPLPNAFVVILGHQLKIISNEKLKSVEHRVITNMDTPRTTIVTPIYPSMDSIIEPAKELIDEHYNPVKYRSFKYQEFIHVFEGATGDTKRTLESFKY